MSTDITVYGMLLKTTAEMCFVSEFQFHLEAMTNWVKKCVIKRHICMKVFLSARPAKVELRMCHHTHSVHPYIKPAKNNDLNRLWIVRREKSVRKRDSQEVIWIIQPTTFLLLFMLLICRMDLSFLCAREALETHWNSFYFHRGVIGSGRRNGNTANFSREISAGVVPPHS